MDIFVLPLGEQCIILEISSLLSFALAWLPSLLGTLPIFFRKAFNTVLLWEQRKSFMNKLYKKKMGTSKAMVKRTSHSGLALTLKFSMKFMLKATSP